MEGGVDIVYFLSRKGCTELPHLIRVHHLISRNDVRLRDVKRCLAELRGKEILDSFSWSCKRKYKEGYVWEDLVDDDIITPVSDDEYVLKGSQISSTNLQPEEKENGNKKYEAREQTKEEDENQSSSDQTTKSPSFDTSASTWRSSTFYSTFLSKKKKSKTEKKKKKKKDDDGAHAGSCKNPTPAEDQSTKGKNKSMLKNLISCGDVETKNSTAMKKKKKSKPSMSTNEAERVTSAALFSFGGSQSQRVFGNPIWPQQQFGTRMSFDGIESLLKNKSRSEEQKSHCGGSHKLVNWPKCSQCGKQFKPEKMQTHMKSCKGLKALSKCSLTASSKQKIHGGSFSGHLITH